MARLESVGEEVVSEEQVTIVNKDWESKDLYSVPGGEDHKGTEWKGSQTEQVHRMLGVYTEEFEGCLRGGRQFGDCWKQTQAADVQNYLE